MSLADFVTEFLGNDKFWFSKNNEFDEYLEEKYQHLLDDPSGDDYLGLAILYDQLPRHVFRSCQSSHIVEYFLRKSLRNYAKIDLSQLTDVEWCFAHLPVRHTNNPVLITLTAKKAWERVVPGHDPFLIRFLKATYERCPILSQSKFITKIEGNTFLPQMHEQTLHFTPTRPVLPTNPMNHVVKEVMSALVSQRPTKLIMSISGGSDSMVAFHIIHGLKEAFGYDIDVVMVNYTNRDSAYDEEAFVADWVNSFGYPLHVRRIDEIKRKQCADNQLRTVYEKYTRDVRYATYKTLGPHPVVMGHNKDDCLENILQNIGSCQKYDNLSGMDTLVVQDGIPFFRPLLDVSKNDIVAYAREHQIPFLPNSTPPTMKRGQIRNKVAPVLNDWNDLFVPGLFQLKKTMADMHKVVEKSVEMFVQNFDANRVACVDKSFLEMGENFWKLSLKKLFPTENISNKMIVSLMETFTKCGDFSKFEINKNVQLIIKSASSKVIIEFKLCNM